MKILIVQSDRDLAHVLCLQLLRGGYGAEVVHDKAFILPALRESTYSLVIMDPDEFSAAAGEQVAVSLIREVASAPSAPPLLVVSAHSSVEHRVAALEAGAEDFLVKPFSLLELAARVRVLLRRAHSPDDSTLQIGQLKLDRIARTVSREGITVELTAREFRLLEFLMRNYGHHVSRGDIIENVWAESADGSAKRTPDNSQRPARGTAIADGRGEPGDVRREFSAMTNIVDVYVNYLRQKLGDTHEKRLIHTVRGIGYRLGWETHAAVVTPSLETTQAQAC